MTDLTILASDRVNSTGTVNLVFNGEMTIRNACKIRSALIDAFSGGNNLHLDLNGVTEVDLTGLQLICAAHISSIKLDRCFSFDSSNNESLQKIVQDAGFLRHIGCSVDISKTCVWTGGENK
jgi:anti-anti-sigma regulatory factor